MKEKHIRAFMQTAKTFAECSTAKRLHVGCIAVKDNKIINHRLPIERKAEA